MRAVRFTPPIDPAESDVLTFDYPALAPGETLIGTPVAIITVDADGSALDHDILNGTAEITDDDLHVDVPVTSCEAMVDYHFRVACDTSAGRRLVSAGILPCREK